MWRQMRREELSLRKPRQVRENSAEAAAQLIGVYAGLAERGEHLLGRLLAGAPPRQWERLPADDAIDSAGFYQWFYHCHGPEDRPDDRLGYAEHGHLHLFARRPLWAQFRASQDERAFHELCGRPEQDPQTRHLLAMGLDAKGVPISLFTVNSWVTGDLMFSAARTARLLSEIALDTGHPEIDHMVASVIQLCKRDIRRLLAARDAALATRAPGVVLEDETLEILSEERLDLDRLISQALAS